MNLNQIERLVATVRPTIEERQRHRLHAYVETARRCEARIQELRDELERTLQAVDGSAGTTATGTADATLATACQLDALERLQPRVDSWLTDYVAALAQAPEPEIYGDGTPI